MKINFEVENLKFKQGFDEGSVEKLKYVNTGKN